MNFLLVKKCQFLLKELKRKLLQASSISNLSRTYLILIMTDSKKLNCLLLGGILLCKSIFYCPTSSLLNRKCNIHNLFVLIKIRNFYILKSKLFCFLAYFSLFFVNFIGFYHELVKKKSRKGHFVMNSICRVTVYSRTL